MLTLGADPVVGKSSGPRSAAGCCRSSASPPDVRPTRAHAQEGARAPSSAAATLPTARGPRSLTAARPLPQAKDNYDEAIEEYEREQNPKAIKNRVRKAQKAAEQALVTGDKMARCGAALKLLGLRDDAYWFQEPVPVGEVPDYLDIVEEPMDFRTIAGRLAGGEYGDDALAFASDVRKVFTNAVKYNWSPDHPCNIAARAGLREFEQLFARANGNGSAPKPPPPAAQPHKKRHRDGGGGAVAGSSSGPIG